MGLLISPILLPLESSLFLGKKINTKKCGFPPQEKQGKKAVSENVSLAHFKTTGFICKVYSCAKKKYCLLMTKMFGM